jgi:hypothetical protein
MSDARPPAPSVAALIDAIRMDADLPRAEQRLRLAMENFGQAPEALLDLGLLAQSRGWFALAEQCCRGAAQQQTGNYPAWLALGNALYGLGRYEEATEAYEQCAALKPEQASAWFNLGQAQQQLGWYVDAVESYERVLQREPQHAEALFEAGRMRFHFRQYDAAQLHCANALRARGKPAASLRLLRARVGSIEDWCARNGGTYRSLSPLQPAGLPLPRIIPSGEKAYWQIDRDVLGEIFVARVADCEVFPQQFTLLSPDGTFFLHRLVTTPSVYPLKGRLVKYWNDDGELLLEAPLHRRIQQGACVLLGGQANYFHWVYEAAARLMLVESQAELRELPLVIYGGLAPTQLAMLDALGITPDRRLFLRDDESLLCKDLYVPSLVTNGYVIPEAVVRYLRGKFAPMVPAQNRRRRIYISRNRFGKRALANEAELLPLLQASGFETIYAEQLSFPEQMAAFASAEAVFGVDGAALSNLFMAPAGAKVGVIATAGLYKPHYYYVSHHLRHDFTYLHGLPVHESHEQLAHQDLYLPRERLEEFLRTC